MYQNIAEMIEKTKVLFVIIRFRNKTIIHQL